MKNDKLLALLINLCEGTIRPKKKKEEDKGRIFTKEEIRDSIFDSFMEDIQSLSIIRTINTQEQFSNLIKEVAGKYRMFINRLKKHPKKKIFPEFEEGEFYLQLKKGFNEIKERPDRVRYLDALEKADIQV